MQQILLILDEEQHLGRDAVGRPPVAPVPGVDPDIEVDEARGKRGRHAVHHAAVGLAVAAGDERRALRQLVLADLAVEDQLVERGLYVECSIMFGCARLLLHDGGGGRILVT